MYRILTRRKRNFQRHFPLSQNVHCDIFNSHRRMRVIQKCTEMKSYKVFFPAYCRILIFDIETLDTCMHITYLSVEGKDCGRQHIKVNVFNMHTRKTFTFIIVLTSLFNSTDAHVRHSRC